VPANPGGAGEQKIKKLLASLASLARLAVVFVCEIEARRGALRPFEPKRDVERVAVLDFRRAEWSHRQIPLRVIALRSTERSDNSFGFGQRRAVQFYVTNDWLAQPEDIPREYDGRAEIEPKIDDLEHGLGLGRPGRLLRSGRGWTLRTPSLELSPVIRA
jgi:hypothetical protein